MHNQANESAEIGKLVVMWFWVWHTVRPCAIDLWDRQNLVFGSKCVNVWSCFGTIKEVLWLKNLVWVQLLLPCVC